MIRLGVHCSIRKGLKYAVYEADAIDCEALQVFTRSPRMWKKGFASQKDINDFKRLRTKRRIFPLVIHTPYLPNLATSKKKLYTLSLNSLKDDIAFCERIDADYIVIHPGAYSDGATLEIGIKKISAAINRIFKEVKGKTTVLIENVAGGGRRVGKTFAEIAKIIDWVKDKKRIGVCFDTAHALGAGYDLRLPKGIDKTLREFDNAIGLKYMKVIHFNDSLAMLGSMKDRHHHIGKGHIGLAGFEYLIKKLKRKVAAGILETPKDSTYADRNNLMILYKLRARG